ncbi:MAG: hypothetical protein P4L90_22515 [Rhodopila sp.]|nr:hypothetical protein [Rhodopila sp.]
MIGRRRDRNRIVIGMAKRTNRPSRRIGNRRIRLRYVMQRNEDLNEQRPARGERRNARQRATAKHAERQAGIDGSPPFQTGLRSGSKSQTNHLSLSSGNQPAPVSEAGQSGKKPNDKRLKYQICTEPLIRFMEDDDERRAGALRISFRDRSIFGHFDN